MIMFTGLLAWEYHHLHVKRRKVCDKTRSPPASLLFKGLGHWAHNCKMAYSSAKRDNSVRCIPLRQLASWAKQLLCMCNIFGMFLWHPLQTYNIKYVNVMFIWGRRLTTKIFEIFQHSFLELSHKKGKLCGFRVVYPTINRLVLSSSQFDIRQ